MKIILLIVALLAALLLPRIEPFQKNQKTQIPSHESNIQMWTTMVGAHKN